MAHTVFRASVVALRLLEVNEYLGTVYQVNSRIPVAVRSPYFCFEGGNDGRDAKEGPQEFCLPSDSVDLQRDRNEGAGFSFPPVQVYGVVYPTSEYMAYLAVDREVRRR